MTEETLFHQALDRPRAQRAAFLDSACAGKPTLRAAVEAMLAAHEATSGLTSAPAGSALDATSTHAHRPEMGDAAKNEQTGPHVPAPHASASAPRQRAREIGMVIASRYTIDDVIGEGGMGSVYLASQTEPVKRQVALKLIKSGMDSKEVLTRFEAERQALALMDHPNIARVYDGGTTPTGQPFFVMELVRGVPITRFCDEHRLGITARLELFVAVCQAVQHAHQKGIIHRDLKPGNVLVTRVDGRPSPKVIDFGVAKAIEQKLTDASIADVGRIVGTPTYMSPEQADPASPGIDTRTDVYALGVILYELLVGSPPFDAKRFKKGAVLEMLRMVREDEPPRPSTKLSSSDALPSIAANRAIEPAKLTRFLRGELDWIVMKALEKDRTRRYETANGFARDIQRYLAHEVVEARPPSAAYRMRKFVRRHRGIVTAGVAVAAALLVGIVGFAWQARIARSQRDRAVAAEDQASKRADELQKVTDYQAKMLQQIDPAQAGVMLMTDLRNRHSASLEKSKVAPPESSDRIAAFERELNAVNATDAAVALIDRTVLAPSIKTIETEFADQPLVDARLRTTLGVVYDTLGRPAEALALFERAYVLRKDSLGDEHEDTLASRSGVGSALGQLQKLTEAERTVRETLEAYERVLGEDHKETLDTKALLAQQVYNLGRYDESESISRDILERRLRILGPDHVDTINSMASLGKFLINRGRYDDAEKVLTEVIEARRRTSGPGLADSLSNLGTVLNRKKEYAKAEPYYRESLELNRREHGEDHPATVAEINNLASLLMEIGKLDEAESLAHEALEKSRRIFGNEHLKTLTTMNVMGQVYFRQNKFDQTEPYYREALATSRRVMGEEHPETIVFIFNLGFLMQRLGRLDEAVLLYREAVEKNRRISGDTHPYTLVMMKGLADLLRQLNKPAEAEGHYRTMLENSQKQNGEDHPDTLSLIGLLGSVLRDQGKLDEAETYFQQSVERSQRVYGAEHANTITAILRMASLRVAQEKNAEAIALITPIADKVRDAIPGATGILRHASLVGLLGKARTGLAKDPADFAAAEANLLEAHGVFAKNRGETDKETRDWVQGLVNLYIAWDKREPEKGYAAQAEAWHAKLEPTKQTSQPGNKP
jgi:tetratricopeptide (TPR) repeat protein